ncbi:hypothetical protein LWC35_03445 [Pseudonocardia kujensis]|uniref:hypothetical protein n=1 Tax=Pseudonocardia kujensis TaxID=1128675 RepID=UPI001E63A448|nr:hypothetical protein [Pseudonocardia kujensis]MCE0761972.1 hypothetical protein [Pseudonocardia kujensis]
MLAALTFGCCGSCRTCPDGRPAYCEHFTEHREITDILVGEDPNTIVTRAGSRVDVQAGQSWSNEHVAFRGVYVQIFTFEDGDVKCFQEYCDTAKIAAAHA